MKKIFVVLVSTLLITSCNGGEKDSENEDITVSFPEVNDTVECPITFEGEARGPWYFEASFPVKLEDKSGKLIAQTIAEAQEDWMTEEFVPFEGEFENVTFEGDSVMIFENANPSGLEENADEITFSVKIENCINN
ncbi:hypothetical protein KKC94_00705 [Patescibacteria group bacterium]|nr:hypothetical protein [Patescibacteria group bacterium]